MPALVNEINNSKAHKIPQAWLVNHKAASGEQLQDVAKKLNELDQPINYSAISCWFANDLNQAKLMPVNWAIKLKDCYPDFPLEEYLRAYIAFYEEHKPSDQKLSSAHAFFEANGIEYLRVGIEGNEEATKFIMTLNNGYQSVPTIIFPDGAVLTEPDWEELRLKIFGA